MRDRLPAQSVPNQVRILERLPVGATGKVDRKALAAVLDGEN
jgi:non-ribosomal peptide synthetase component E (peptide arylation enzyme)